jgi:hypothetical protein
VELVVGSDVVHLEKGLARIVANRVTAGMASAIVQIAATGEEVWVPVQAWAEHLRPLPDVVEAAAWRDRALDAGAPRPLGGRAAATRRERTLHHRVFERQLDALCDAYRSGDRSDEALAALAALEARLLPLLAPALATTPELLAATLRAAMPTQVTAPPAAPPALGPGFEPVGRGVLTGSSLTGDPNEALAVEVDTLAGPWLAYLWTFDRQAQLVAIHADHVSQWRALLAEAAPIATAGTDCAQALLYDPALRESEQDVSEIWDPVEPGLLAGRGFSISIGGDGDYELRGATRDGKVVLVVTGDPLDALAEHVLRGVDREAACLETLAAWRDDPRTFSDDDDEDDLDEVATRAIDAITTASPAALLELERVLAVARDDHPEVARAAAIRLACLASEPARYFQLLVDELDRGAATFGAIASVLRARREPAFAQVILERLAAGGPRWAAARSDLAAALADGGYPEAGALIEHARQDADVTVRLRSLAALLAQTPISCELARDALELIDEFPTKQRRPGFVDEWDAIAGALDRHAAECRPCRIDWVTVLFRIHRTPPDALRRLAFTAPGRLKTLTGTSVADELWVWLGRQRAGVVP